ncbi:hypothetical protein ACFW7J_21190 [Streptomyces sp. NPDC059525]|uniref:hypothetical protein n=1 Tax=Streptomyces sp. NPDC059525 TaxID=3346857 RepID=UPI0036747EDE
MSRFSPFPEGKFTIVNDDTGRCVRVRLARTQTTTEVNDKAKFVRYVTGKPSLELGPVDNTAATAWWFSTIEGRDGPYNQIVSHAVDEYQNIGSYCVWMYRQAVDPLTAAKDAYRDVLFSLTGDTKKELDKLIPERLLPPQADQRIFHQTEVEIYAASYAEAAATAWAQDEDPIGAGQFAIAHAFAKRMSNETDDIEPSAAEKEVLDAMAAEPRATRVNERMAALHPEIMARLKSEGIETEQTATAKHQWYINCASAHYEPDGASDEAIAFNAAAAAAGIQAPELSSFTSARTGMYGCGADSSNDTSAYRWWFENGHIYGGSDMTQSGDSLFWTDDNGRLVGRPKGSPGQKWTVTKWTPSEGTDPDDVGTGLYGAHGGGSTISEVGATSY